MKKTAIPLLVFVACFTFTNLANPAVSVFANIKEQIVYSYIAAFNAREIDEMLEMVADDVQWLTGNVYPIGENTVADENVYRVLQLTPPAYNAGRFDTHRI